MPFFKRTKSLVCIATALTISFCSSLHAKDNSLTEEEKSQGWQLLFDGKDMSKWRNYQKAGISNKWVIDNGALHLSEGGGGDIMTKASFEDFKLKLEWKISERGNSGIFFLVDELGKAIYSHAPEVQILDNERHPDNKKDSHLSGSLYGLVAAHKKSHKPAGEWNQVVIRLEDNHLQVWQNGVSTASIVIGSSTWNKLVSASKFADWKGFGKGKGGHIGLQDHNDPVWFKNIKIKAL